MWQKKQDRVIVSSVSIVKSNILSEEKYPQHITEITGSDEVWYSIPELGIRLRLNNEFARDLIYQYSSLKDETIVDGEKKHTMPFHERVSFSTQSLQTAEPACVPGSRSIGEILKEVGDINDWSVAVQSAPHIRFDHFFLVLSISLGEDNPNTPICYRNEKSQWSASHSTDNEIKLIEDLIQKQSASLERAFSSIEAL